MHCLRIGLGLFSKAQTGIRRPAVKLRGGSGQQKPLFPNWKPHHRLRPFADGHRRGCPSLAATAAALTTLQTVRQGYIHCGRVWEGRM